MIKTWQQRCEEHPDHEGIVTEQMIRDRMQEEIDQLRQALAHEALDRMVAENQRLGLYDDNPVKRDNLSWVGLTDEEIESCNKFTTDWGQPSVWLWGDDFEEGGIQFARAIEAKLKEKNT